MSSSTSTAAVGLQPERPDAGDADRVPAGLGRRAAAPSTSMRRRAREDRLAEPAEAAGEAVLLVISTVPSASR